MWELIVISLVIAAATSIYTYVTMPQPPERRKPHLSDIKVPTAEEGRMIPVAFGTVQIESPMVAWYGDLDYVPVKAN